MKQTIVAAAIAGRQVLGGLACRQRSKRKSGGMSLSRNGLTAEICTPAAMKVRVEVRGVELEIPCGDGDQVNLNNSNP
jgi:hypothetical protein